MNGTTSSTLIVCPKCKGAGRIEVTDEPRERTSSQTPAKAQPVARPNPLPMLVFQRPASETPKPHPPVRLPAPKTRTAWRNERPLPVPALEPLPRAFRAKVVLATSSETIAPLAPPVRGFDSTPSRLSTSIGPADDDAGSRPLVLPMEVSIQGESLASTPAPAATGSPARGDVDPELIRLSGPPAEAAPLPKSPADDAARRAREQNARALKSAKSAIRVQAGRTKLLQTRRTVARTVIANPRYLEVIQFSPHELAIIGKQPGKTTITVGFQGTAGELPETFEVTVHASQAD
jgi:hypothetical protein